MVRNRTPTVLRVKNKTQLTPNMLRITFNGEGLLNFPSGQNGAHIKLVIPNGNDRPKVRTYTVRDFDAETKELTVDFALHQPAGPATSWAIHSQEGYEVGMVGPGPKKLVTDAAGWYLFAADMSAMPAAIASIEELPEDAEGEVFFEITDEKDKQEFDKPDRLKVHWLVHSQPHTQSDQQLEAIQAIDIPPSPNVFVAGELGAIKKIKSYLLKTLEITSRNLYISSYWKIGANEEEHKQAKAMG
ncbi:MAG: siderophore-interacting protein [Bacteroidota bacterium]